METKSNIQEKRAYLKELSNGLKILKKEGAIDCINEGLKSIYAGQGHTELKTIYQWNEEGKRVRKGEKAFLLWGRPKKYPTQGQSPTTEENNEETNETDFYPLCYVFSNLQVI